ncbi:hypothetical protein D3C75_1267590 [compost metagenome]
MFGWCSGPLSCRFPPMFDSELVHQALVKREPGIGGGPWADGFCRGFDVDQTIPDGRVGWHQVAALSCQGDKVGVTDRGW